ncbi:zinc (zn2)-iron (fe2) permease family [Plasmopara halstedii]|uniref:Zinc (Zn2 )-iron (Fe2 ) permease family n=1 Tax=Plasmopara halstedii TaxID=4781 RepID=A0A0P1AVL3_PLAHL|nr:zinc (zn2)-iron (fe2) permease family [Plasmopara halstedii]CEG45253.1 zinc (zn2)-iron (fe2) permease family [Plasmopara halstedii]|eukprot:XP_024581622.1 zinc (zn2)-iron (fe2) permease family [Plasmopara halstedii]
MGRRAQVCFGILALLSIALISVAEEVTPPHYQEHLEKNSAVHQDAQDHDLDQIHDANHDDGHIHDHNNEHDHGHDHELEKTLQATERFLPLVWGQALLATALVGAAPVLVLLVVPLGVGNQERQQPLLRIFLSFAAGGLLGDALLHLLPHSLPKVAGHANEHNDHSHDGHDHNHEGHSHSVADLYVWLWTLAGILVFLFLEKFVRAQTRGHGHSHGHSHASVSLKDGGISSVSTKNPSARKRILKDECAEVFEEKVIEATELGKKPIAPAGYLNLAADFSHNFTDGLAIGATFLRGSGWTTTVAMLLHELPHEIGDFAILIQSGFTRREAMATQLLTASGAMVGTVIGLVMEGTGDSSSVWISPFTAGGFIYIACTSVMPELLEDCSLAQSLKEAGAMCSGIGLMVVIALSE